MKNNNFYPVKAQGPPQPLFIWAKPTDISKDRQVKPNFSSSLTVCKYILKVNSRKKKKKQQQKAEVWTSRKSINAQSKYPMQLQSENIKITLRENCSKMNSAQICQKLHFSF